jgi:hypothetical protein
MPASYRLALLHRQLCAGPKEAKFVFDWSDIQTNLPQLPIPPLEDSCALFKEMLEPLMDPKREMPESIAAIDDFLSGAGPKLDTELRRRDAAAPNTSYVKPFWDKMYLGGRYPVPINSNPFIAFEPDRNPEKMNQASRAASLVFYMCKFLQGIRDGTVSADMVGPDTPGCTDEYSRLFSTTRIPHPDIDELRTFPDSKHIVIFRDDQIYSLEVLDGEDQLVPEDTLRSIISTLLEKDEAAALGLAPAALAVLTTMEREEWARVRVGLESGHECNRSSLGAIDSSILAVSLDRHTPSTDTHLAEQFMHGGVGGSWSIETKAAGRVRLYGGREVRWYDKSIVLMVAPSADASIIFEHSPFDGSCVCRMADDVWHDSQGLSSGRSLPSSPRVQQDYAPVLQQLEWALPAGGGALAEEVREATKAWHALQGVTQTNFYTFRDYGTSAMKGWGLSPDGLIQSCYLLAYRWMHSSTRISVYASCSTKRFLHGRTEAIRCNTTEMSTFVHAMADAVAEAEQAGQAGQGMDAAKRELLRGLLEAAVAKHRERSKEASMGRGVDRHLFSLANVLQETSGVDAPALFSTDAWSRFNTSVLSCSNCTVFGPSLRCVGYGAVCANGYGLGYVAKPDQINVCITNYTQDPAGEGDGVGFGGVAAAKVGPLDTDAELYGDALSKAFRTIRALCEA